MKRIEVLFDYSVIGKYRGWQKPRRHYTVRIVRDTQGGLRVDQKGINAKSWRTVSWGGSPESHYAFAVCDARKGASYWQVREAGMP